VIAVTILLYAFGGTKGGPPHRAASNLEGSPAAKFTPFSTSFPTHSEGWVLGTVHCSVRPACMQLRSTRDGGATWNLEPLPEALLKVADERVGLNAIAAVSPVYPYGLLNVRFANVRDGWIYGTVPSIDRFGGITTSRWLVLLWSTHDGGRRGRSRTLRASDHRAPPSTSRPPALRCTCSGRDRKSRPCW